LVIAIDGPAGSGKSTVAREVGKILGIQYLDSGALYRALTFALYSEYCRSESPETFPDWLEKERNRDLSLYQIRLEFMPEGKPNQIFLNGSNITQEIRTPEITEQIRYVANQERYRKFVNDRIRKLAETHELVLDGRDIGTEVFPDAPYKFFLTASPEERARRRTLELRNQGMAVDPEEVLRDMISRDESDRNRKIAPLVQAKDAILVDTDALSLKVVIETILSEIEKG
jgi:cytidylate kinase